MEILCEFYKFVCLKTQSWTRIIDTCMTVIVSFILYMMNFSRCESPLQLKGQFVDSLRDDEFTCHTGSTTENQLLYTEATVKTGEDIHLKSIEVEFTKKDQTDRVSTGGDEVLIGEPTQIVGENSVGLGIGLGIVAAAVG